MGGYLNLTGKILLAEVVALAGLKLLTSSREDSQEEPSDPDFGLTPSYAAELRGHATRGDHESFAAALRRKGCTLSIGDRAALWRGLGGT